MKTYQQNYEENQGFSKSYGHGDMVATTIAQNLNVNLSNIIDDVKKQRMDIVRLNNELKNSRFMMNKKNYDEVKSRQELNHIFRSLKKESEHYQQQLVNF